MVYSNGIYNTLAKMDQFPEKGIGPFVSILSAQSLELLQLHIARDFKTLHLVDILPSGSISVCSLSEYESHSDAAVLISPDHLRRMTAARICQIFESVHIPLIGCIGHY